MRLLTKEGIERLLLANPIAGLAAELGIALAPLGSEMLVGRCPRHEGTAGRSLLIEPGSGRFRCLVCPLHGGNVIGFVMQVESLPFMSALERLAKRAGLDLDAVMIAAWHVARANDMPASPFALPPSTRRARS